MSRIPWSVETTSHAVATIRIPYQPVNSWEQWGLLSSDRHIDNPKSDTALQKRHLDLAKERNAFIIDTGDLFCAMQGKFDKRSYKPDLKDENKSGDYLGSLVRSGLDLFTPYRDNLAVIGEGNHESAIRKRAEFDLTSALVERLQDRGAQVVRGGYRFWVQFKFDSKNGKRQSYNMYCSHGGGGGGPVTKGVIKTNRRAVYLPDAHIVAGGHIHESWLVELTRARLSSHGREYQDTQTHISLPTYKQEFLGADAGFHHENERPPKPIGAWWIRFYHDRMKSKHIQYELRRAK
jgi:hypothetical protein